jgi:hypothetical protein
MAIESRSTEQQERESAEQGHAILRPMPEDHPGDDGEHQPGDRRCYDPFVGAVEPRGEAEVPQLSHSCGRKTNDLI